jgi:membrane peptidoglycan carboxypeptidase
VRPSLSFTWVKGAALGLIFLVGLSAASWKRDPLPPHGESRPSMDVDAVLRAAAIKALGKRDGAVLILDAQTGRIRALLNPRFVFQETFAPGSTIKPFTTLVALRSGAINENSTMVCGSHYKHAGFEINCTHLRLRPPFTPALALAYSCNYYFAKVGEGLN